MREIKLSNSNNFLYITSILTLLLTGGFVVLIAAWLLYPYKVLVFKDKAFPVLTKEVKSGGVLRYRSNYCKYAKLTAKVSRSFINGIVFSTPTVTTDRTCGCNTIIVQINVPDELPPGKYHLENIYKYEVNPIRSITIKQNTESFIVK